jgi:DNA-binding CsgD family transcriptional regulator
MSSSLTAVLRTDELFQRAARHVEDDDGHLRCAAIIREIPHSPAHVLRRAAAEALLYCDAHSAGVSLQDRRSPHQGLHMYAAVGPWAHYVATTLVCEFSPDGIAMQLRSPQLFCRPDTYFSYLSQIRPAAVEMLLVPLDSRTGTIGALWVVLHEASRLFDRGDARRLQALSTCASAAYDAAGAVHTQPEAPLDIVDTVCVEQDGAKVRELSWREAQVCRLVACGHTNKVIGEMLGISAKSVETYRARIADKLGLRTRADVVRYALERRWL